MSHWTWIWLGVALWVIGLFVPGWWALLLTVPGGALIGWHGMALLDR